jgi:hypothetical protein
VTRFFNDFSYSDPSTASSWEFGDHLAEALGTATISFAALDDDVSNAISFLLQRGVEVGRVVTAELSFKNKLHLLGSLFRHAAPKSANVERMRELLGLFLKIEAVRNQVIHSSWIRDFDSAERIRRKYTAKMSYGFREETERLAAPQLLDISFYCGYLGWCLDQLLYGEFGLEYGEP